MTKPNQNFEEAIKQNSHNYCECGLFQPSLRHARENPSHQIHKLISEDFVLEEHKKAKAKWQKQFAEQKQKLQQLMKNAPIGMNIEAALAGNSISPEERQWLTWFKKFEKLKEVSSNE